MITTLQAPAKTPQPKAAPTDYTLYGVQNKYYVKSKAPGSTEREITKQEYDDLLQTKNNSHGRLHK